MTAQNQWLKLVTRESTLLERTLRFDGYVEMLPAPFTVKLKDLLAVYEDEMTTQYTKSDDLQSKINDLKHDYNQIGFKKIVNYFQDTLTQLTQDAKKLKYEFTNNNWHAFCESYKKSRAIILYSYYLAGFIKQNSNNQNQINILQKIYDDAEKISSSNWKKIESYLEHKIKEYNFPIKALTLQEFNTLLITNKLPAKHNKASVTIMKLENYKSSIHKGTEAQAILKKLKLEDTISTSLFVTGQVAHTGHVQGPAKIILKKSDYSKVQTGDIIITQMTHPDMLPILHKAAGIITEEGGILCHAAIVSRELNKPCIIGTKTATKTFSDYDLVDLNCKIKMAKYLTEESCSVIKQT